jgi:hypothetical protein
MASLQCVQKFLDKPSIQAGLSEFLTREIEGLDRLTDQVMSGWESPLKKKPKRVEQVKEACVGA